MRAPHQLVHSRARIRQRYALFPLEGYPTSRLPGWQDAEVRVLAAPAIGAKFAEYLIDLPADKSGGFSPDGQIESFVYVLSGAGDFGYADGPRGGNASFRAGSFALVAPGDGFAFGANEPSKLLVLRKRFEPCAGIATFKTFVSEESKVKAETWGNNPSSRLQTLIPDELSYDFAMNIFTFDPGHGLPYVETHVMEHGLLVLEGKGLYYLDGEWMEVEKDDFIWMGPYCPQSYYATGPTPTRYIYYKNVNREIPL